MYFIKPLTLVISLTLSLFSMTSFAQDLSEAAIADRIAPVGGVYLHGEIETASQSSDSDEPAGPRTGEAIYNTYCLACHGTGAAGAPMKGDADAWQARVAQGPETLVKHAIEGLNAMPPKGTCGDCTDDEITATVEFLTKGLY